MTPDDPTLSPAPSPAPPPAPVAADVGETALLGGRVRLLQPTTGYRAGMDAALLAAAVAPRPGDRLFEAGCGAGAVLMQAAARHADLQLVGLERDPAAAGLARRNAALNDVSDRTLILTGDVADRPAPFSPHAFDWAVSNPPFFDDETALRAPAPGKRGAWIADDGLTAWTGVLLKAVRDGGRILVIHRADRLADILSLLGEKAGSFAVLPIQPHADQPAKRVLVQAIRSGRAPLRLLPPLVLHDRSGDKHTPRAEAILRGEAALEL